MADTNETLANAIHLLINKLGGPNPTYGMSLNQMGDKIGMGIGSHMTADPVLQMIIGNYAGKGMGKLLTGMFPGAGGVGLNINDNILRRAQAEAHQTLMDSSKQAVDNVIAEKKADFGKNMFSPFFGIAANLTGVRSIASGMDPSYFGYQTSFGAIGKNNRFISDQQDALNTRIYNKLYGKGGKGGLIETVTRDYLSDTSAFGDLTGEEVGAIAGDRMSRGLDSLGTGDSQISQKIQKAARSIKSIRDIISGPLKEVVAQMEQTFGSGYLNTFGAGGAADLVNRMRAVGQMGGFSTRQIMQMAPATQSLIQQAGGRKESAGLATTLTGIIMGMTRGKNKEMIDEGDLTKNVVQTVVGAQQSRMSRVVASAESLISNDKSLSEKDRNEKLAKFREKVRQRMKDGGAIDANFLAETMGDGTTAQTIIANRNSVDTEKTLAESTLSTEVALKDQNRELLANRKRAAIAGLGGKDAYEKMLAANKGKSEEELLMRTNINNWKGMENNQKVNVREYFNVFTKPGQDYTEQNLILGNTEEMLKRNQAAKDMASMYSDTSYGAGLGVNLYKTFRDKGDSGLKGALDILFNSKNQTVAGKNLERMLMTSEKLNKPGISDEDARKKSRAAVENITWMTKTLGLQGPEAAEFIEKNIANVMTYQKRDKEGNVIGSGWDAYRESDEYKALQKKARETIGRGMEGDEFDEKYKAAKAAKLEEKRGKNKNATLNANDLMEVKRDLHIKEINKDMDRWEDNLSFKESQGTITAEEKKRLKAIKEFNRKRNAGEISKEGYDEALAEIKDDMGGTVDSAIKKLETSEKDMMTSLATFLMEKLPAVFETIDAIGTAIDSGVGFVKGLYEWWMGKPPPEPGDKDKGDGTT